MTTTKSKKSANEIALMHGSVAGGTSISSIESGFARWVADYFK